MTRAGSASFTASMVRAGVACGAIAAAAAWAAPAPAPPADAAARLAGRALGDTPLERDLRELCDVIGGRPTGSAANERAVAWAAARFRDAGIEDVALEPFTVPALWLGGDAAASCVSPETFPIRIAAAPYSASTPAGPPLEARLVDGGSGAPADFERLGPAARGAVALVRTKEMATLADLFAEYMRDRAMMEAAEEAGLAGVLLTSTRPRGLLYRHPVGVAGRIAAVPAAVVSREHAHRLSRLMERGEVRVRLGLANATGGPYQARNVVAEIRGRERPEEIVVLGGHLDSWDLGTGAEDNGVNVALILDVARGMKALGPAPRRTVRFVLFNGEEQGMWGSRGYAEARAAEMPRHAAAVVFDIGSGRTGGFYLNGREELRRVVDAALAPVAGLGGFSHPIEPVDGTDNFDFLLWGVPNLVAAQEPGPYLPDYHAESDVVERVNVREARANAAIASALVWALAESPERPARTQTRAEVERLIRDFKLDEQMKAFGQWEDWEAGRRGSRP
jgi:hypothetical protein